MMRRIAVLTYLLALLAPLTLATVRLLQTAGNGPLTSVLTFSEHPFGDGALRTSLVIASLSTLLTVAIGTPLAWWLGHHDGRGHGVFRATLTLPFLMPTVVCVVGFLTLMGPEGPLVHLGIDLRRGTGAIGRASRMVGIEDLGLWIALLTAHAWFNIALVIRFLDPLLRTLDDALLDQLRVLPRTRTRLGRLRHLWIPLCWPPVVAGAALTFIQCFTSFVLVRHLLPTHWTIERVMAEQGGAAGIEGYGAAASSMVLGGAIIQVTIVVAATWALGQSQRRMSTSTPLRTEHGRHPNPPPLLAWVTLACASCLAVLPLLAVASSSVLIRGAPSVDGWVELSDGIGAGSVGSGLRWSLVHAVVTLGLGLPLAWCLASAIVDLERSGQVKLAALLDAASVLPIGLSAALIGLGILVAVVWLHPPLLQAWWLATWAHLLLSMPFAVRVLLGGFRRLDPNFTSLGKVLGLTPWRRWWRITLPLMRRPTIAAGAMILAVSLGEFGSSWVLLQSSGQRTLPLLIDAQYARAAFDPIVRTTAAAGATVLILITGMLFLLIERRRDLSDTGGF